MPYDHASVSGVTSVAYAHGKPVIVSDAGSLPETVDEGVTGLVVPRGDSSALASAMVRLFRDADLRRRMGTAGKAKLDGELSWAADIHRVAAAYAHAVLRRRVRGD